MNSNNLFKLSFSEKIELMGYSFGVTCFINFIFYKSIYAFIFLLPLGICIYQFRKNNKIKEKRWKLNCDFQELLISLSSALNSGYSMENSIGQALKDLKLIFDEKHILLVVLEHMDYKLQMNMSLEKLLSEFAKIVEIDDINNFVEVYNTARRTGGDLIKIMQVTSKHISEKIEFRRETKTILAAKKLEAKIMSIAPLGIIAYIRFTSPNYLDVFYSGMFGRGVMSVILLVYLVAFIIINKVVNIEI